MIKLPITDEQREMLKDYFAAIVIANSEGRIAAIGAQIWEDGIVVKLFYDYRCVALSNALGGHPENCYESAADRMSEDAEE